MKLSTPFQLGPFRLSHRVVMPPLTRMRAGRTDFVPSPLAAAYYAQRATEGGLIIAEATQISQQGQGYPQTPGIYTPEQVAAWRTVTRAVRDRGGVFFLQLWHVGRISHSSFHDGAPPVAPSAIWPAGNAFASDLQRLPYETPRKGAGKLSWPLTGRLIRMIVAVGGGLVVLRAAGSTSLLLVVCASGMLLYGTIIASSVAAGTWF